MKFCCIIKTNCLLIPEFVTSSLKGLDACGLYVIVCERIPRIGNTMIEQLVWSLNDWSWILSAPCWKDEADYSFVNLLPYRMRRYKESKLWCQVCMPLQDESLHPTIEARPVLWVGLWVGRNFEISEHGTSNYFSVAKLSDGHLTQKRWNRWSTFLHSSFLGEMQRIAFRLMLSSCVCVRACVRACMRACVCVCAAFVDSETSFFCNCSKWHRT